MKHSTLDQLQRVASVRIDEPPRPPMSRNERLEYWAELLESEPDRPLATLHGTEYQAPETRAVMRCAQSAISIAFDDPTLRAEGMKNDTYGEAKRFFDLSDWQLHGIVCHCHFGASMTAEVAAQRVRTAITGKPLPGLLERMRQVIGR
jgi:hypothetical protein